MTKDFKLFLSMLLSFTLGQSIYASQDTSSINITPKGISKNSQYDSVFESKYINVDSKANTGNLFIASMRLKAKTQLKDNLLFNFDGGFSFESGNSDSLFDNSTVKPESQLAFRQAEFVWNPLGQVSLQAGAIGMKDLSSSMLLSRGAFLGARESVEFSNNEMKLELSALQAIPNNRNYSDRVDAVEEEDPRFFLESLKLTYGDDNNFIKARTSHFAFDNLSNSVAYNSALTGNSAYIRAKDSADLVYSYQGWVHEFESQYNFKSFRVKPNLDYIINTAAPENNEALTYGLELGFSVDNSEYSVRAQQFRAQRDATVAFYQSRAFYYVNHEGQSISFTYEDFKEEFRVRVIFSQMKEIEVNQLEELDTINSAVITLRKNYEIF